MLVSIIMMGLSGGNSWSQLLTFMPVRRPMRIELPQTRLWKLRHCEQSDTESSRYPVILKTLLSAQSRLRKKNQGQMELNLRRFRKRLGRKLALIIDRLKLQATSEDRDFGQRMCPFCGLITSCHKTCCLECGKSLKPA
jgi:hypothetical protein